MFEGFKKIRINTYLLPGIRNEIETISDHVKNTAARMKQTNRNSIFEGFKEIRNNTSLLPGIRNNTAVLPGIRNEIETISDHVWKTAAGMRDLSVRFDMMKKDNDSLFQELTEELDSLREDQASELEHLKNSLNLRTSAKTSPESDRSLMKLIQLYRSELISLETMMETDEAWKQQIRLAQEKIRQEEAAAGIYVFGAPGEAVNYDMHTVAEVKECDDPSKDKTIESVYEEGFMIHGKIEQKAIVSAYKYGGSANESADNHWN